MRERIHALIRAGRSYQDIALTLGCAKSTVAYHARKLSPARPFRRYDWQAIQSYHNEGHSLRDCQQQFGFCKAAWNDAIARGDLIVRDWRIPLEELLVSSRPVYRGHLKRRLLREGLLQARCYECGLTEWRGKPLSFDLHHVNGNPDDNRLENLMLLCPNCHSQTPNYCGRNTRRQRHKNSATNPALPDKIGPGPISSGS